MCSFWLPKAGNQPHEYEDAFWPARFSHREARVKRLAVADGATEASFSGLWARMLVRACGRGQIRSDNLHGGSGSAAGRMVGRRWSPPLPWYAEEKLRSGAFSSLPRTEPQAAPARSSSYVVCPGGGGHMPLHRSGPRADHVLSYPGRRGFDNSPQLISSVPARNRALDSVLCRDSGVAREGDRFYLATDALACWFLARHEEGAEPWNVLDDLVRDNSPQRFADWMGIERRGHRIRNDDVTLLRFSLE